MLLLLFNYMYLHIFNVYYYMLILFNFNIYYHCIYTLCMYPNIPAVPLWRSIHLLPIYEISLHIIHNNIFYFCLYHQVHTLLHQLSQPIILTGCAVLLYVWIYRYISLCVKNFYIVIIYYFVNIFFTMGIFPFPHCKGMNIIWNNQVFNIF